MAETLTDHVNSKATSRSVAVAVPLPVPAPYDYLVPEGMKLTRGDVVEVPLGNRHTLGIVWGPGTGGVDPAKLKPVAGVLSDKPLPTVLSDFLEWLASYSLTPPGQVIGLAVRSSAVFDPPKMRTLVTPGGPLPKRMTDARQRVMDIANDGFARTANDLAGEAGVGVGVVRGLIEVGALIAHEVPEDDAFEIPKPDHPGPELSADQAAVASELQAAVNEGSYSAHLIDGVTGSGKTEVYFEAVAEALRHDKQVLILVPEIALTVQFLKRFEERFGCRPAEWHSDLSQKERRRVWRGVADGSARVIVGARSALFLPFPDLGLIIVDEEHEKAFKQEDGVVYHGRDMGVVRAHLGDFPIVLASATPSLETVINVDQGKFHRHHLGERHGEAVLPDIATIDLRQNKLGKGEWLADPLVHAVTENLRRKEQTLLFLNRRGYAPLTVCNACGHRMMSPESSTWLVEHRYTGRLIDHLTGFSMAKPKLCPACAAEDTLAPCGPGVERVAEEVQKRWPDARLAVMSSDVIHSPAEAEALIEAMAAGAIDILIGTQMVAKGHNFPGLTLVGVVDADLGLKGGDLRAAERTFQLLQQVSGRAGRAGKRGRVLLQTRQTESPVIEALVKGDRDAFLQAELDDRRDAGMPPYARLAAVILSSLDAQAVEEVASLLAHAAPNARGVDVWGPAPAPYAVVRGRHRHRFLVRADKSVDLQAFLRSWLAKVTIPGKVRLKVDIDPYSFL